jgi:hypothetical protein
MRRVGIEMRQVGIEMRQVGIEMRQVGIEMRRVGTGEGKWRVRDGNGKQQESGLKVRRRDVEYDDGE